MVGILWEASEEADDFTDGEGDLDEAALGVGEGVIGGEDEGDALGAHEDYAEAESGPESEEEDYGLGAEEMRGANYCAVEEIPQ